MNSKKTLVDAALIILISYGLLLFGLGSSFGWKLAGGSAAAIGAICFAIISYRNFANGVLWWRDSVVHQAITDYKLQGFAFQLLSADVQPSNRLTLRFKPVCDVPQDKTRQAHLALRCIVAFTLPKVVESLPGFNLNGSLATYIVDFGVGVTIPFYELHSPAGSVSDLQVGSEIQGLQYLVTIFGSSTSIDSLISDPRKLFPESSILRSIATAFLEQYGAKPVIL